MEVAVRVESSRRVAEAIFFLKSIGSQIMTVETSEHVTLNVIEDKATCLRIDSVRSTTEAGSGHPTSCRGRDHVRAFLLRDAL